MSDIAWDDNARAAVMEFYRWANARFKSGCSVDADIFLKEFAECPQTKTVADEQEGEKWTHEHLWIDEWKECALLNGGEKDCNGCHAVISKDWGYALTANIRTIKPKLTETEAIGILLVNKHLSLSQLMEDYDIT